MVRSVALSGKVYQLPDKENTEDVTIRVTFMINYVTITTNLFIM